MLDEQTLEDVDFPDLDNREIYLLSDSGINFENNRRPCNVIDASDVRENKRMKYAI